MLSKLGGHQPGWQLLGGASIHHQTQNSMDWRRPECIRGAVRCCALDLLMCLVIKSIKLLDVILKKLIPQVSARAYGVLNTISIASWAAFSAGQQNPSKQRCTRASPQHVQSSTTDRTVTADSRRSLTQRIHQNIDSPFACGARQCG